MRVQARLQVHFCIIHFCTGKKNGWTYCSDDWEHQYTCYQVEGHTVLHAIFGSSYEWVESTGLDADTQPCFVTADTWDN